MLNHSSQHIYYVVHALREESNSMETPNLVGDIAFYLLYVRLNRAASQRSEFRLLLSH